MHFVVINGPNINLLSKREGEHYAGSSYDDIIRTVTKHVHAPHSVEFFQSNHEGQIIDFIQALNNNDDLRLIVNLGAFTHTSIALRDALLTMKIPFVEVHISNIYNRESFRHHSYISDIADGCIVGCGVFGYCMAVDFFLSKEL